MATKANHEARADEPKRSFRKARRTGVISARQQRKRLKAYRAMEKLLG